MVSIAQRGSWTAVKRTPMVHGSLQGLPMAVHQVVLRIIRVQSSGGLAAQMSEYLDYGATLGWEWPHS